MSRRRGPAEPGLLLTCEHASRRVPNRYACLFEGAERELSSHRGWDPGALQIGRRLARAFGAPLVAGRATRLLVDLNRTEDEKGRFSRFGRWLPAAERRRILSTWHEPHWSEVERHLARMRAGRGRIVHVACHSFTPRLGGRVRAYELGLLYDPRRVAERRFVRAWREALRREAPEMRVRLNRPYAGWTDGMTTTFRGRFGAAYVGIELECNQEWARSAEGRSLWVPPLVRALRRALQSEAVHVSRR